MLCTEQGQPMAFVPTWLLGVLIYPLGGGNGLLLGHPCLKPLQGWQLGV